MARALHSRLPAAKLKELEGVGTFAFIERPELFAEVALPFLGRHLS